MMNELLQTFRARMIPLLRQMHDMVQEQLRIKVVRNTVIVMGLLIVYLLLWPTPVKPVKWLAPPAPGYTGPHAVNTRLENLQTINIGAEAGPEHIAVGPDGRLYAAMASGRIVRMATDGTGQEVFVNTQGRVLGFDFDAAGNVIAADAVKGLLSIASDKAITVLADKVDGDPIRYADAVAVAKNGCIYFSDASMRFAPKDWGGTFEASVLDILEQSATGRILEYDPQSKTTRVVAHGLSFANGVALSKDEQTLFVAETGQYRVWKVAVNAQKLDLRVRPVPLQASIVLENLPGFPDNLMRGLPGADGKAKIWLGFAKPRNPTIDNMAGSPFMRKLTLRLPRFLWPIPPRYGHVMAFTEDGKVVADLQDPSGAYPETTGVTETADRLYVQSLHAKTLGWVKK
jgi:sugar lactone lactonase YvrE